MNVISYNTKDYENKSNWTIGKNKPNQTQSKPILERMNLNFCAAGSYESKTTFEANNPNVNITTAWSSDARIVA